MIFSQASTLSNLRQEHTHWIMEMHFHMARGFKISHLSDVTYCLHTMLFFLGHPGDKAYKFKSSTLETSLRKIQNSISNLDKIIQGQFQYIEMTLK